jgi:hypothetical protein
MATTKQNVVHARLDAKARRTLDRLRRKTGLTDSELIRRALEAYLAGEGPARRRRVIGLGEFESGEPDLGSNPDHLEGFGRS